MQPKTPNSIDVDVGRQIRLRRKSLSISQTKLAEKLGITFQQVQKYEAGMNRVGASRLQAIADALGVEAAFFFNNAGRDGSSAAVSGQDDSGTIHSFISSNEGFALNRAFFRIKSPLTRRSVVALVKSLAEKPGEAPESD